MSNSIEVEMVYDTRKSQLAEEIRSQIVSGQYDPGSRLPTRAELLEEYSASNSTVQQALDDLIRNGFVETRGRAGTFVAQHPPHLTRLGLAYLFHPGFDDCSEWSRFHHALNIESMNARLENGRRFVSYYHLYDRQESNTAWLELCEDIQFHHLAGLIMVGNAGMFEFRTHELDPELPRVCLDRSGDPEIPSVVPDMEKWLQRAARELVQRGRKRLGLIEFQAHETSAHDTTGIDRLLRLAADAGASAEPIFYQPTMTLGPTAVSQTVRLLMSLPEDRRPDALIVNDDNLVESTVHGLVQSGVKVGPDGDIDVVVHANFPHPVHAPVPLIHLGYDVRLMLATAIKLLDEQRGVPITERPRNREIVMPIISQDEFRAYDNPLLQITPAIRKAKMQNRTDFPESIESTEESINHVLEYQTQ